MATIARLLAAGAATALLLSACSDQALLEPDDGSVSDGVGSLSHGAGTVDVIVVLKEGFAPGSRAANRSRAAQAAEELGVEARFTYGSVLFGFAGPVPEGRLNALRNHPLVDYVDFDEIASIPPTVNHHNPGHGKGKNSPEPEPEPEPDPQFTPWGTERIGAAGTGATGTGVSVYILDTGIDSQHPDLQANLGEGYAPVVCEGCSNPWDDDRGHGTHVAGTVGAIDNSIGILGVAPQVTLHAVKVLGSTGTGHWSGIIAGIDWVAAHNPDRARVINMSLGGTVGKAGSCTADGYSGDSDARYESICNAKNAGVVIVASAGNAGSDAASYAPASFYDAVITVSAAECELTGYYPEEELCGVGADSWTAWSNWGVGQDDAWPSRSSLPVLLSAPGLRVASTVPGGEIGWMSGTSMASPHVAGAVARLLESGGYASDGSAFDAVRQTLLDNAECTAAWENRSGNPHFEPFLDLEPGSGECAPPPALPDPPAAPTGLVATGISDHEIRLTWQYEEPVPTDIQFQVARWIETNWVNSPLLGQDLSFTDFNLTPETSYRYRVRASYGGVTSEWSDEVVGVTHPVADVPEYLETFSYNCQKDVCEFTADYQHASAHYTWSLGSDEFGYNHPIQQLLLPHAGEHEVKLTIVHGTRTTTSSQTVTCESRGKHLRCQ